MRYLPISQLGLPYMECLSCFWHVQETKILVACQVVASVGIVIDIGQVHDLIHDKTKRVLANSVRFLIFLFSEIGKGYWKCCYLYTVLDMGQEIPVQFMKSKLVLMAHEGERIHEPRVD